MRTNFIGTILVVVLGVNLGAWTLSVATSSPNSLSATTPFSVPVSSSAINAQAQSASVAASVDASAMIGDTSTNFEDQSSNATGVNDSASSSANDLIPTLVQ